MTFFAFVTHFISNVRFSLTKGNSIFSISYSFVDSFLTNSQQHEREAFESERSPVLCRRRYAGPGVQYDLRIVVDLVIIIQPPPRPGFLSKGDDSRP